MARTKPVKTEVKHLIEATKEVLKPETKTIGTRLSESEMRQIESFESQVRLAKLEMSLGEQYLVNLTLQKQAIETEIVQQKSRVSAKASAYELARQAYDNLSREIFSKHGITNLDKIGFDSTTGKIIFGEG